MTGDPFAWVRWAIAVEVEEAVPPDIVLAEGLKAAALCPDRLTAFAGVVSAFCAYADARNAPQPIRALLTDMLGDIANLDLGRPPKVLVPRKRRRGASASTHDEALWTVAAVYIDIHDGKQEACKAAERKLGKAGLRLPSRSGDYASSKPGASLRRWRMDKGERPEAAPVYAQLAPKIRADIERLARTRDISVKDAAGIVLDDTIEAAKAKITNTPG